MSLRGGRAGFGSSIRVLAFLWLNPSDVLGRASRECLGSESLDLFATE